MTLRAIALGGVLALTPSGASLSAGLPEGFEIVFVASGLERPTAMEFAPDGRLFVLEQVGRVRIVRDGVLLPVPFLGIDVNSDEERGLLGVAFDPEFDLNRYLFLYYSRPDTPLNRLARYVASAANPDLVDTTVPQFPLIDGIETGHFHNGGALRFAADGTLFLGAGDARTAEDAQDNRKLTGKLLRIFPDGSIPPDNMFADEPEASPQVWAMGLRNPFSIAIDSATGRVFVNDVGESSSEEINEAEPWANYGWPKCEGACSNTRYVDPVYAYEHGASDGGCAITGGTFYRASQFPEEYAGSYFFSDFCSQWLARLTTDDEREDFGFDMPPSIVDLDVAPDGSLYALSYTEGTIHQIRYAGDGNRSPLASIQAEPLQGAPPLLVHFSGAESSDPDGDALTYSWDFGEGSSATGVVAEHTYTSSGFYTARLTVADAQGGSASASAAIQVGNPPTAAITSPASDGSFRAGQRIAFAGDASDPEDGPLPAEAFSWTVLLHHHAEGDPDHHTHPVIGPLSGREGSFEIPLEVHEHEIWYRIYLTATDSDGLRAEATRTLLPEVAMLTLATSPPGLTLALDGQPRAAPFESESIVGSRRTLEAPATQESAGVSYRFVEWSDGGVASHSILTPAGATTYTAVYAPE